MGGEAKWFGEVRDQRYLYSMTADVSDTMAQFKHIGAIRFTRDPKQRISDFILTNYSVPNFCFARRTE